jgi:transposase
VLNTFSTKTSAEKSTNQTYVRNTAVALKSCCWQIQVNLRHKSAKHLGVLKRWHGTGLQWHRQGNAHHWNDRPMGRPKTVNEQYLARLKELVSHSPREYGYPFQRWTAQWLGKHLAKELGIKVSDCHINRLLKEMGLSTRQRRESAHLGTDGTKDSNIIIGDLQSSPDPNFLWSLNLIKTSN